MSAMMWTTLRRSRIVQCLAYGCLLGLLSLAPAVIVRVIGLFPQLESSAQDIAWGGGVPAAVAGAVAWFCIVLQRRHTAPTGGGVFACWFGTAIGSYLLVPIWIGVIAVWRRCSFDGGPSAEQCWETFRGMVAVTVFFSGWGFVFTAPVVLPFLFLGAWLWVRRLHPRLAGPPVALAVSG